MAALTVTTVGSGAAPTVNSASASDTVTIDSGALILWFIGGAGSNNVTIDDSGLTPGGNSPVDPTFTLPSGSSAFRTVKIPSVFQNSSAVVTITNSAPTGVTVYALRIYPPF
jgi:hypothetical protein